jgi:hypothetical protein
MLDHAEDDATSDTGKGGYDEVAKVLENVSSAFSDLAKAVSNLNQ